MPMSSPQQNALSWLSQPAAEGLGSVRSLMEAGAPAERTCDALARKGLAQRIGFARWTLTEKGRAAMAPVPVPV